MLFYGNGWEATIDKFNGVTIEVYGEEPISFYHQNSIIEAKAIIKAYCPDYSIIKGELKNPA